MSKNKNKNQSNKGFSFERDMCKQLSLWWTNDTNPDVFWRTAGSGGRFTRKKSFIKNSAGDIGFLNDIGKPFIDHFLVELKRGYNEIDILNIFKKDIKKHQLIRWWLIEIDKLVKSKRKEVFFIWRPDYKPTFLIIKTDMLMSLCQNMNKLYRNTNMNVTFKIDKKWHMLSIVELDKFLDWCAPNHMEDYIIKQKERKECYGRKQKTVFKKILSKKQKSYQ